MDSTDRLSRLIRSTDVYQYRNDEIQFLDFTERDGIFLLYILRNGIDAKIEKDTPIALENFLNQCKKIEFHETEEVGQKIANSGVLIPQIKKDEFLPELLSENKSTFKSVGQMLMDDIKKVRDNKDYVPQAKQASNSAQALINLVKVQLDIIRHG